MQLLSILFCRFLRFVEPYLAEIKGITSGGSKNFYSKCRLLSGFERPTDATEDVGTFDGCRASENEFSCVSFLSS